MVVFISVLNLDNVNKKIYIEQYRWNLPKITRDHFLTLCCKVIKIMMISSFSTPLIMSVLQIRCKCLYWFSGPHQLEDTANSTLLYDWKEGAVSNTESCNADSSSHSVQVGYTKKGATFEDYFHIQ